MIELSRPRPASELARRIRIFGLGGAATNALDRIMLDGFEGGELVALNTDVQALNGSVAPRKIQLGANTTRGLGAGGDPEVGYAAAEESIDEVKGAMDGAEMIFLVAGLGGGTGSGAAPLIASYARAQGSLVVVFATMPFAFEGRRRLSQAEEALTSLQHYADIVICFENDGLGDLVSPRAGIHEAFIAADQTLSQSVRAIAALTQRSGLLRVGFDDLQTVLRAQNSRCLFGYGEAEGDNRAHVALERALKSPLLDRGRLLEETQNVLVNVVGGPDLTLNEVQILMEGLNRHVSDRTRLLFGTGTDPRMGGRMSVLLLSASERTGAATLAAARPAAPAETPVPAAPVDEPIAPIIPEPVSIEPAPEAPRVAAARASGGNPAKAPRETKQEQMTFQPVTRGRFEKSEPTIVNGEDLDVPAFMRRNVRLK